MPYARKVDLTQPTLVQALEKAGVQVWVIGQPCDLLCRFWCSKHNTHCWQPLEVKTPYGKKNPKARVDPRQTEQIDFLQSTQTPVVTSSLEALLALSTHHGLASQV